jgi:hypothetical protein
MAKFRLCSAVATPKRVASPPRRCEEREHQEQDNTQSNRSHSMADTPEQVQMDTQEIELETPPDDVFMAPSIYKDDVLASKSYSHFSPVPQQIADDMSTECVLGVDEAGRGPVLGQSLNVQCLCIHHS